MKNKYEQIVDELLEKALRKEWMDDQDYSEIIEEVFKFTPKSKLVNDLKEGESNGYSIEDQKNLLMHIFKNIFSK